MARIIGRLGSITLLLSVLGCTNEPTMPPGADGQPPLVQVAVQPAQVVLAPGAGIRLHVEMVGVEDTPLGLAGVRIQWMSSDDDVVTVSPLGFVEARRLGTATVSALVTAPCGIHVAVVSVQVVPAVGIDSGLPGAGE
jgi:hypothetical protein